MILAPAQAEAVLAAMAHLNNIGASINSLRIPETANSTFLVKSNGAGTVVIERWLGISFKTDTERYESQAEFAAAYGLN